MKGSQAHYDKRQKSRAPMRGQHFIVSDIQNLLWKEKAKSTSGWPLDKAACEIHDWSGQNKCWTNTPLPTSAIFSGKASCALGIMHA